MTDEIYFRFAGPEDSEDLLRWRNDPVTRKYSFNTKKVQKKDHVKWFGSSLSNPKRNLFIVTDSKGSKLGQVRFDREGRHAEIDIAIAPESRSRGIGTRVLKESARFYLDNFDVQYIIANIKHENIASVRAFEKSGYKLHKDHGEFVELRYAR